MTLPQVTDNCLTWYPRCNAECCRQYSITFNNGFSNISRGVTIQVHKALTKDMQLYYKLHGAKYVHGDLIVVLNEYRITGDKLTVLGDCQALTRKGRCKYHGTNQQPLICANPITSKSASEQLKTIEVTPNCLCNYR